MDVLLNDDEQELRDAVRKFLAVECPTRLVRSAEKDEARYSKDLWRKMAQLGWLGISLPEACGGQGLPLTALGLLLEEAGRHIAPVPLLPTLAVAQVLARHGPPPLQEWVAKAAAGEAVLSFAVQGEQGRWDTAAADLSGRRTGDGGWVLRGTRTCVDNFAGSDRCLVLFHAGDRGVAAALVDPRAPGIAHAPLVTLARDAQSRVRFEDVAVRAQDVIEAAGAPARELCDLVAMGLAAQMAGAARRELEMATEHAKLRVAFEQPIGSFQVIQHLLVDMLIAVDAVELLAREAFWRASQGLPASVEASQAKAFANEKCVFVARSAQQIHGGMGFMAEFDLNLWYRRIGAWALRGGSAIEHRRLVARALLDRPGAVRLGDALTA